MKLTIQKKFYISTKQNKKIKKLSKTYKSEGEWFRLLLETLK